MVRWETAVREEKELDSSIVTTLDSGCTVFIVESQTLASGRERCWHTHLHSSRRGPMGGLEMY